MGKKKQKPRKNRSKRTFGLETQDLPSLQWRGAPDSPNHPKGVKLANDLPSQPFSPETILHLIERIKSI